MEVKPNRHDLPPAAPPTIPGGALNPEDGGDLNPSPPDVVPPIDRIVRRPAPAHTFLPAGTVHRPLPPPPGAYDVTDPKLFWMNNRPFLLHRSVGKGGFGEVYRAEMMLPPGVEVSRNPTTGAFILDEQGRVEVHRLTIHTPDEDPLPTEDKSSPSTGPAASPSAGSIENIGASDEEVAKALELSEATPASMNFFHVEEIIVENNDGQLSGRERDSNHSTTRKPFTLSVPLWYAIV